MYMWCEKKLSLNENVETVDCECMYIRSEKDPSLHKNVETGDCEYMYIHMCIYVKRDVCTYKETWIKKKVFTTLCQETPTYMDKNLTQNF